MKIYFQSPSFNCPQKSGIMLEIGYNPVQHLEYNIQELRFNTVKINTTLINNINVPDYTP